MKFNKIKLITALCLALGVSAFGQNNVGTLVTDPIRPFSVNSTNPSAIANEIKGGPFSSSNLAGLSNIPAPRLELGALGYAADTGLYYRLTATSPATWSSINGANITNIPALGYNTNDGRVVSPSENVRFTNTVYLGGWTTNETGSSPAPKADLEVYGDVTIFAHEDGGEVAPTLTVGSFVASSFTSSNIVTIGGFGIEFAGNAAGLTRTNLGLNAWTTNTNSPVFVGTNGEVVSPTNFWQVAPIVTRFVEFDPATNATTNIVAARNLHIHSLAISRTGVTSTIALPTNNVFNGDIALVVHQGPTSSVTAIRQAGAGTNLITLNQPEEAVEFVYYNSVWQFNHNVAFVEPIYFSGTNAPANAAASRTNLGLGNISTNVYGSTNTAVYIDTNFVATNGAGIFTNINTEYLEFRTLFVVGTNTNAIIFEEPAQRTNFIHSLGLGPTNSVIFLNTTIDNDTYIDGNQIRWGGNDRIQLEEKKFQGGGWEVENGAFNVVGETNKATTRTNLGLPLPALTNTNNADFRTAIELGTTNNVTFNDVTASGTLTATSTVTAKTNLVVEGFVDFTTNRAATNGPTNAGNFNTHAVWITIKAGTNTYFLPAYQ